MLTVGSLFSGYGGLDFAVEQVYGARTAWHSEVDPPASKVLAAHWPDVPNLGDITAINWAQVEPVDILTGGFPCQDISSAGLGRGIKEGTRSGLWYVMADAVRHLRPRLVVVENVSALLVRGLDIVLGDLADLGYDAQWVSVRASDVGAPHRRQRVFLTAHPNGTSGRLARGAGEAVPQPGEVERLGRRGGRADLRPAPDAAGGRDGQRAVAGGDRRGQPQEAPGGRSGPPPHARDDGLRWGPYAAAVARWEHVLGRPAPHPVDDRGRLSPHLVEWMMGLPDGWVTDLVLPDTDPRPKRISRSQALKALGNGVVPQQAAHALRLLHPMSLEVAA